MGNNFLSFMRLSYEKDLFPHCSEAQFNNHEGDFTKVFFQQIFNWKKCNMILWTILKLKRSQNIL